MSKKKIINPINININICNYSVIKGGSCLNGSRFCTCSYKGAAIQEGNKVKSFKISIVRKGTKSVFSS